MHFTCGPLTGTLRGDKQACRSSKKYLSFLRVPGRNPQNSITLQLWAPNRSTQVRQTYFVCALFVAPDRSSHGATNKICLRFICGPLTGTLRGDNYECNLHCSFFFLFLFFGLAFLPSTNIPCVYFSYNSNKYSILFASDVNGCGR